MIQQKKDFMLEIFPFFKIIGGESTFRYLFFLYIHVTKFDLTDNEKRNESGDNIPCSVLS